MSTPAHVYLAEPGAGAFERHFKPESEFAAAGVIELNPTEAEPFLIHSVEHLRGLLELVFAIANSYSTEMHAPAEYAEQVRDYRARGNRSLSMGDVVAIGESFWFCASNGWEPITEPSRNLIEVAIKEMPCR